MAQTIQTTQSAPKRQTASERTGKTPEPGRSTYEENARRQTLAFQAMLAGASPERLPRQLAAEAAKRIGNSAMEELARRNAPAETLPPPRFPEHEPQTAPFRWEAPTATAE